MPSVNDKGTVNDLDKKANMLTSEKVKEYGLAAGAKAVGIAASKDFVLAPEGFKPTDIMEGCVSVIIVGYPIPQEAILGDPEGFIDIRNATNEKVNEIAKNVAKQIKADGYKAQTINGIGGKWVDGIQRGHTSLKHAAELAGLGVIGRNILLINPEYGSLLWFSAVFTNAELVPDERVRYDVCSGCNKCVEMCPAKALDDPASFKKKECANTMFKKMNGRWELVCYQCRKVCPHRFGIR